MITQFTGNNDTFTAWIAVESLYDLVVW